MSTAPFDLRGPLPEGVVVLEASAGTGKTYAIAALVARYVAAGTPLEEILVVTFTRLATGELRERVRARLVTVADGLDRVLGGADPAAERDEVVGLLAAGELPERARDRLRHAITDFDAATIATTHGFAEEALRGLGIAADVDRHATFAESLGDLAEEVVDDLYLWRFAEEATPPIDRREAGRIAAIAVDNPRAPLRPAGDAAGTPGMRSRLAERVRLELELRKRRLAVLTFDDLLTRLDTTLAGSEAAVAALRDRFRIVLIDEFQDTDPLQWSILERAFVHPAGTLVLIGDPKQAVYAFRGADVYAYLRAVRDADVRRTLGVNHRSDEQFVRAVDRLFDGARLGEHDIEHRPVAASENHRGRRLLGAPVAAPLRIRVLDRTAVDTTRGGKPTAPAARAHVAADLAGDVVALLDSGAEIERRGPDGTVTGTEAVHPGHVAVLVRANAAAVEIQAALADAGVPAVIAGAGSVFDTQAATDWLRLLAALERPSAVGPVHTAALTPFVGWDAAQVAGADEDEWERVHARLHRWSRVLRDRGVAALLETMTLSGGLPRRVLEHADGERELTDLRHLGQLLHEAAGADGLGVTALAAWLRERIAESGREDDVERARRLESDARAVQVMTIHRAKGLEFPIVYLPSLADGGRGETTGAPVDFHDPAADHVRTLDVGLEGEAYDAHRAQALVERRGEDLRLAYVALTRARHQAVLWWSGTYFSGHSPLSRLVFDRAGDGTIPAEGGRVPSDAEAFERFRAVADETLLSVEWARVRPGHWSPPLTAPRALLAADFGERGLDHGWRRTSFSDLTAGTYEARVGSEPEEPGLADEPDEAAAPAALGPAGAASSDTALLGLPAALGSMPAGTRVGTAIHLLLESTDYAAADLDAELHARLAATPGGDGLGDPAAVVAGLRGVLETPLGPLVGDGRLRDVTRADRLDELQFELPLRGGEDAPADPLDLRAVGALLRATLPEHDRLAAYADRLEDPLLRRGVRGYLTGSIDLVLRDPSAAGGRFVVVDFKTNRLAPLDEPLTAWHYRPAALAAEMVHAHYALQALLYSAALHRYLRWRLRGYDPERHLGGVLYLFLRGMTGPDTPRVGDGRCGVFSWRPPAALVTGLSDLLDRP